MDWPFVQPAGIDRAWDPQIWASQGALPSWKQNSEPWLSQKATGILEPAELDTVWQPDWADQRLPDVGAWGDVLTVGDAQKIWLGARNEERVR